MVEFTGAHLRLQSTLATAKSEIDAAAKAAREEARKKIAKPSNPTNATAVTAAPTTPEPEPPPLFAQASFEMNTEMEETGGATS